MGTQDKSRGPYMKKNFGRGKIVCKMKALFFLCIIPVATTLVSARHHAGGKSSRNRFMQSRQPVQEKPMFPVIGDADPAPYPVVNVHMAIPNNDQLAEESTEKDRYKESASIDQKRRELNNSIEEFQQIAFAQRDQMKNLIKLAETSTQMSRNLKLLHRAPRRQPPPPAQEEE